MTAYMSRVKVFWSSGSVGHFVNLYCVVYDTFLSRGTIVIELMGV